MIFTAPLVLLGLLALPALWLLLRLNPPPPRRHKFPPLALLRDLASAERTPYRMPLWLLLLRLAAAALLVVGLAGPSLRPPALLPGSGNLLLVIDNGWAAAADWQARMAAAAGIAAAAARAGRDITILATAPAAGGTPPHLQGPMTAVRASQVITALQPSPWPVDRLAARDALVAAPPATRIYLADGITDGPGFTAFFQALRPDSIISGSGLPALLGAPQLNKQGGLTTKLISGPPGASLLAQDAAGNTLARAGFGAGGEAAINLPPPLADRIAVLSLDGPRSAGGTVLLDSSSRPMLVGLAAAGASADTPFLGALYFIRRALPAGTRIYTGSLAALVAAKTNIIILADLPLSAAQRGLALRFITGGGVLVRFAGPLTAASPDPLTPDPLLPGDRRLGGALSWAKPLPVAAFASTSPLQGLPAAPGATVSRQILADPTRLDPTTVWASLSDGTPLILGKAAGRGLLVAVLTSANADWSNLALSGLYPPLLARLTRLGQAAAPSAALSLPLQFALSADGGLTPATGASITAGGLAATSVSAASPAGLYGTGAAVLALNLGGHVAAPKRPPLPDATPLLGTAPPIALGAWLIAAALLLLLLDLGISLQMRGLLKSRRLALLISLTLPLGAQAQTAALQTTLGYILTGDAGADQLSADGLGAISADVSNHTSAQLGNPIGLNPATDDLGLYPLIYWPLLPSAPTPAPAACAALSSYMAHGGLLVIDTPGGDAGAAGSGAGFAPGAAAAVARVTACLELPPLVPLTTSDSVSHSFYIVRDFPGRFAGAPVLIATATARDADNVSPVIIGQNDWAGAWARYAAGDPEQTPIPGGEAQRVTAERFGTNLVIYALTGSYKSDPNAAPVLLDKLGP